MTANEPTPVEPAIFLVFGDLHGKILPAFRLAACWAKDHDRLVGGMLQVGDLGYFPDPARLDKATVRHAEKDPLELGTLDVVEPNDFADQVFADPLCPPALWFTAGNHEDFDALDRLAEAAVAVPDFSVDHYGRVRCINDGMVVALPPDSGLTAPLRVGAVWGVDGDGPNAQRGLPPRTRIRKQAADRLKRAAFDVLLSHDAPQDARWSGYGSKLLRGAVETVRPAFAFFGHYGGDGARSDVNFGTTEVYHMAGLELAGRDGCPTPGSVGVLEWANGVGTFEYVPTAWLNTFTRHNWKWR